MGALASALAGHRLIALDTSYGIARTRQREGKIAVRRYQPADSRP